MWLSGLKQLAMAEGPPVETVSSPPVVEEDTPKVEGKDTLTVFNDALASDNVATFVVFYRGLW